ncbi:prepilin peptidase [Xanthobacter sp. DSM 14520]|uniref:prepilin peptidase n=1 Tax=Xanthobacter autotrophicus (strain ATCC BAA-1158 / Py2) TaxID=78245 RepID=UPI00372ACBAB
MPFDFYARLVFSILVAAVAVWDVRALRIPDKLNLAILGAFVVFAAFSGFSAEELVRHVAGGALLFALFFAFAMAGPLGGGDVKFAGAIGVWIGFGQGLWEFVFLAAIYHLGLVAAAFVMRSSPLSAVIPPIPLPWVEDLVRGDKPFLKAVVPFGVPLAASALVMIWA